MPTSEQRRDDDIPVPGSPAAEPPRIEEQTDPHDPLPPKPDQEGPQLRSATGSRLEGDSGLLGQQGAYLTTAQGLRLGDSDHSLKAGPRGPLLLQDHHLREKITHFDHERIPERVVHARGTAAHGVFTSNGAAANVSKAAFLASDVRTPVFVRFSTVVGSRGSADTARDTRGFATKFYTSEGVFDLVGNNIPVFFIQDAIKFPDVVHAVKPEPGREIPQAQSAHDTFWDFVSLHTEAQAHTLWNMSDRAIPRSLRMMEGFGVHTFRLVSARGDTSLVKFHWKPHAGVHSLTWEEAQMIAGADPDFHRRDLADAIDSGAYPAWDLGLQVMPDTPEETFEGIDLLDPTKFVPEELAPVRAVGTLTLTANPVNFFAETEQVAFHPGHLVPGIDVTNDALLQGRLFSYLDTQLSRLGGPNFAHLPINRPHVAVNDMLRDGMHQGAVHSGAAPYRPNSLDGGCPFTAGRGDGAFIDVPVPVPESSKVRQHPASFGDHFSQARLFFVSLSPTEQEHVIAAYSFELGKCYESAIKERQLRALANIDSRLCKEVARGLGLSVPRPTELVGEPEPSPALSQLGASWPVSGRQIGVVADETSDLDALDRLRTALHQAGMSPLVVAPHGGLIGGRIGVQRAYLTAASIEFDALVIGTAAAPAPDAAAARDAKAGHAADGSAIDGRVAKLLAEAWRHGKPIGTMDQGTVAARAAGIPTDGPGVVTGDAGTVVGELTSLLGRHRVWGRFPVG